MMNDPLCMFAAYFEGRLNAEEVAALENWLREDPARSRELVRQAMLDGHLTELMREQNVEHVASNPSEDSVFGMLAKTKKSEQHKWGDWVQPNIANNTDPQTRQKYLAALSYVVRHTFTPRRLAYSGIAATMLLGVILLIVLLKGDELQQPIAESPEQPALQGETLKAVASLTNERDAVWSRRPGQDLYAGQSFELIEGFAEITTSRGAIAILEAPATIELLDNDNALRLHTGKLVGICETESSKGFVVRTPHMDITDLGTRFGVDASQADTTEVHVFAGQVRAAIADDTHDKAVLLSRGESAKASDQQSEIALIEHNTTPFIAMRPEVVPLPSTGIGLARGQADNNWSIVSLDQKPLDPPVTPKVSVNPKVRPSLARLGDAQWIVCTPQASDVQRDRDYLFQTRINLPASADRGDAALDLQLSVGDALIALHVNGKRIAKSDDFGDGLVRQYRIDQHLVPGENVIGVEIRDHPGPDTYGSNLVGLIMAWQVVIEPHPQAPTD